MGYIDVHTHLLPFIDDGVSSKEQCVEVLKAYQKAGFDRIIATPHIYNPYVTTRTANIRAMYQWASQEADHLGIKLYLGSEVYIGSGNATNVLPFMDRFVLVEVDYYSEPMFLLNQAYTLLKRGLHVVLAHVERYRWFSMTNPTALKLRELGVHFQCNVDGVENHSAAKWLSAGWIDVIASDNHGDSQLPPRLAALLQRYQDVANRMNNLFIPYDTIQ